MGPRCLVQVLACAPVTSGAEDRRLWGELIQPCNPILQGCDSSNSWARALLHSLLQDLHSRSPVQIGQQVDDINHHSHGTFFQSLHWSVEATCMLDKGLSSLGLTLSQNKSTVIASHQRLLRVVRRELLEQGISFENGNSVRDVGLDATAGQRRSVKIQRKRERKCRKRGVNIKIIQNGMKHRHATKRLFKTRILPALGTLGWARAGVRYHHKKGYGRRIVRQENEDRLHHDHNAFPPQAKLEIQRFGSHWISSERGSSSKAKIWSRG